MSEEDGTPTPTLTVLKLMMVTVTMTKVPVWAEQVLGGRLSHLVFTTTPRGPLLLCLHSR